MSIELHAVADIPDIKPGDELAKYIVDGLCAADLVINSTDILVIAHKIISKAEGQMINLAEIRPSETARQLGEKTAKDPRKVEVILRESQKVLKIREATDHNEGLIITRHRLGFVSANAAIDESNVGESGDVILLPVDPDHSARQLREKLFQLTGQAPGIVISDTFGRPWRLGQVNVAIGLAGVPALTDLTETCDAWGRKLTVTKPAIADELAAASGLLMAKSTKTPVIVFRGVDWSPSDTCIQDLLRPTQEDLF
ncbi:coenzyme F420-0:L-glutamate ligase [Porticoccaceae bacterium]|nr:coenzyme F420-0:L-glutamate ligase [Porticoccaceae bacterium]